MGSQMNLVCKGPVKVSASTPLKASPNDAHDLVQSSFEYLKGWRFDRLSRRKNVSSYLIGISWISICVC